MEIDDFRFPDGLYYDEHDQWARLEGDVVVMGLTDYGQSVAGDVVFVAPPQRGTYVRQGKGCGTFESGKWVGRMYAPVSGTVIEVNEKLSRDPRVINRDPYGEGWIAGIKATDPGELGRLMDAGAARALVLAELERYRAGNTPAEGPDGES